MLKQFIKKTQGRWEKKAKTNENSLFFKMYMFLLRILRPVYFSNEFLILNGFKRNDKRNPQSILFFSVYKSASTFIKNTLIKLLADENLTHINLCGYLSLEKQDKYFSNKRLMSKVLLPNGFFYSSMRAYYDFPGLDNFKILLVLRDPRDVLTSHYFSTLYNHPLSRMEVYEERKKFANTTIDEYVLANAAELGKAYDDYCNFLLPRENVLFLTYEDMVSDFEPWINRLCQFLELRNKENIIRQLVKKTSFTVEKEDPHSFIRNIQPGDHKNKLKKETIAELNKIFKNSLIKLNYEMNDEDTVVSHISSLPDKKRL